MAATAVELLADRAKWTGLTDEDLIERVRSGETALYEIIMRRYNQRLYRVARAILRDESEAEDVLQETYVRAYTHLDQFAGRAKFSTWLTKIAVYEALARFRRRNRWEDLAEPGTHGVDIRNFSDLDPERQLLDRETKHLLEAAIDALPQTYRSVFMLREIEELSTAETAECLDIAEQTVRTRLHRARAVLRKELYARLGATWTGAFSFGFSRCDRTVASVLEQINKLN